MPELRRDPLSGIWTIMAEERSARPNDYSRRGESGDAVKTCPFCPGNEAQTPPEIDSVRRDPGGPWQVRVFANKYPALLAAQGEASVTMLPSTPLETRAPAYGAHEVVITTPHHRDRTCDMSVDELDAVLALCQYRVRALLGRGGIQHVLLMENYGPRAGASREHAHLQLLAAPVVLPYLAAKVQSFADYEERHEACILCEEAALEIASGERIVQVDEHHVTYAAYASRLPYEMRVVPRLHQRSFVDMASGERRRLASHLRGALRRLDGAANDPPYNWVLVTAPADVEKAFHWHIEILPRLTISAGFEWGAGAFINPLPPEKAAEALRRIDVQG